VRIAGGWRGDAVADPAVEGVEKGALSPGVVIGVGIILNQAVRGAGESGAVLGAGE